MAASREAILCMLAGKLDLKRDSTEDRLKLQKTVYLLQAYGLWMGYGFSWYKYGPYSQDLVYEAYRALNPAESPYKKEARKLTFGEKTETRIAKFKEDLGDTIDDAKQLELLASVHFVKKTWYPDCTKADIVQRFRKHKKLFFDRTPIKDAQIEEAFDRCNSLGLN